MSRHHHHRRHSRRHRSSRKSENYCTSSKKSCIKPDCMDTSEDSNSKDNLCGTSPCVSETDESSLGCMDDFNSSQNSNRSNSQPISDTDPSCCTQIGSDCNDIGFMSFIDNLKRNTGKMATICTSGGDCYRCNFTGMLIGVNDCFIRLVIRVGSGPDCAPEDNYNDNLNPCSDIIPFNSSNIEKKHTNTGVSTFVDIPIDKITSFIHSNV